MEKHKLKERNRVGKEGKREKKEGKEGSKGKRPDITAPHIFFYEEKLTWIWGLSTIKIKFIYILLNLKKGSKNLPILF